MTLTIQQALTEAESLKPISESWRLDGELLLAHVLRRSREYLIAWPEHEVSVDDSRSFLAALERRKSGEPIAYIVGRKAFWDFELEVNQHVLIPRPETELLVEQVLELRKINTGAIVRLADLGTGSGAIAIALARENPGWQIDAVDISEDALQVARHNSVVLEVGNINFLQGSWCEPLDQNGYDFIVANPPYVAPGDRHLSENGLPFEPSQALVAGQNGLSDIFSILRQARGCLKKDSWLLMEHGAGQQQAIQDELFSAGYFAVESHNDYAGLARLISAQWPG